MAKKTKETCQFLDVLSDLFEMPSSSFFETPQEIVLMEDDTARCQKTKRGYSIRSGRVCHGRGKTAKNAWTDAVINILQLPIKK